MLISELFYLVAYTKIIISVIANFVLKKSNPEDVSK